MREADRTSTGTRFEATEARSKDAQSRLAGLPASRRARGGPRRWPAGLVLAASLAAASPGLSQTLVANPGPANNGGSSGWAIFFDVTATSANWFVTKMTISSTAVANATFSVEVFRRTGTALGGPVGSGPGSSSAGWTSLGTVTATQGAATNGISLPIDIPIIALTSGQLTGIAIRVTGAGPRYFGTGTPPYGTYSDANLTLQTGDARSAPFTTGGAFFSSRELVGSLTYSATPVELMTFSAE